MYSWIWRHLPFGRLGRALTSLVLVTGVAMLLWYVIFPAIEPRLPFNDGQLDTSQTGSPAPGVPGEPAPNPADGSPGAGQPGPANSARPSPSR